MQKLILSFCILLFILPGISSAQNQNLNSAQSYLDDYEHFKGGITSLMKAKEKIDLASANENTADKYKTWFYRGKIYVALFNEALKSEMNKSTESENTKKLLAAYNAISVDYLDEALKAFQKELELDTKKKTYEHDVQEYIKAIANNYSDKAYANLENKNYSDAIQYYSKSYDMKLKMNIMDTAAMNNMAICAVRLKDYKKAGEYYEELIQAKYKPEKCYLAMIQMYNEAGDTAAARKAIMESVTAMPDSYALLIEKINLLLKDGNSEKAINSINKALEKNPKNQELHLVLGQTYNKLAFPKNTTNKSIKKPEDFQKLIQNAENEFKKTIEIKPDYIVGLYCIGVFYNNLGADILRQAENIKDMKKSKIEENKADVYFKKAIPLLEKAHELDPEDKDTMKTLRQLYALTNQANTEKYKKLDEELKK